MSAVVSNPDVHSSQPRRRLVVERLPPVTDEELRKSEGFELSAPRWLRLLGLTSRRADINCLRQRTRVVKRVLDVVVASILLVLSIPVMILAAIAIKLTSPGPIFW